MKTMKKKLVSFLVLISLLLLLFGCSDTQGDSYFRITFIDVGQGDSALIECDGHNMLIDAGEKSGGEKVCQVLKDRDITHLDILVASHLHDDHIGGMGKVLEHLGQYKNGNKIGLVLSNSKAGKTEVAKEFIEKLGKGNKITVPNPKEENSYTLGSAEVKVIDSRAEKNNDSLVLMVTYRGKTFLFAGDMEQNQESKICDRYGDDTPWDITLLKVAHHGSKSSTSIRFLNLLMPEYAIISVGKNREPDHPSEQTLSRLEQADVKEIYRTDKAGDIIVEVYPDGREMKISPSWKEAK